MRIVFHGENACSFSDGFADRLGLDAEIALLPDILTADTERDIYASADVIIGVKYDSTLPCPGRLRLFHVPGAGYDNIDLDALPDSAVVCNYFGHEQACPMSQSRLSAPRSDWTTNWSSGSGSAPEMP